MIRIFGRHGGTPLTVAALAAALAACGGTGAAPELPAPSPDTTIAGARGVPGFDTRDYPGDAVMATWRESSPYRWVGYYLSAPCFTGMTWNGRRTALERMGWGLAVLFVGEQDWAAGAGAASGEASAQQPGEAPRCTRSNLTTERGSVDAEAAAGAAAAEGFAGGTVVYLDVERVDRLSPELSAYVRAWFDRMLADGRYTPGLYAHRNNAAELLAIAEAAFEGAGRTDDPRLWVVDTGGFSLRRGPTESGFPEAVIWQGLLDARETYGGHTLRIDANVAASANPSG